MEHISVDITYTVYQSDGTRSLLVGKYICRCVAEDVQLYLLKKGINSYIIHEIEED